MVEVELNTAIPYSSKYSSKSVIGAVFYERQPKFDLDKHAKTKVPRER